MGDQQQRGVVLAGDGQQQFLQPDAGEGVDCAEGLVEQQQRRPVEQAAGDGHPLRHAARQRLGQRVGHLRQTDLFQQREHVRIAGARRIGVEADVLRHGEPGQQPRLLEDDADVAAHAVLRLALQRHRAVVLAVEAGHDAQQRALTAAAGADQADDLAGFQRERKVVQHAPLAEALGRYMHIEQCGHGVHLSQVGFRVRHARPALASQAI